MDRRTEDILHQIEERMTFFFCTISMLEVGFGPKGKADPKQIKLSRDLYHSENTISVDNDSLYIYAGGGSVDHPRKRYVYNPSKNEYLSARERLIRCMEIRGVGGKRVRELSNDALIFSSAWNSRCSIVTNNIKDFHSFNETLRKDFSNHLLPIFSIDDLEISLESDVSFPENIFLQN